MRFWSDGTSNKIYVGKHDFKDGVCQTCNYAIRATGRPATVTENEAISSNGTFIAGTKGVPGGSDTSYATDTQAFWKQISEDKITILAKSMATQTEKFMQQMYSRDALLIDTKAQAAISNESNETTIDNVEININVDEVSSEQDWERAGETIKKHILEIASKTAGANRIGG